MKLINYWFHVIETLQQMKIGMNEWGKTAAMHNA